MGGLLESKRFWAAIASVLFALLHDKLGLNVSEEMIQSILEVVAAFILGDSVRKIAAKNSGIESKSVFELNNAK